MREKKRIEQEKSELPKILARLEKAVERKSYLEAALLRAKQKKTGG